MLDWQVDFFFKFYFTKPLNTTLPLIIKLAKFVTLFLSDSFPHLPQFTRCVVGVLHNEQEYRTMCISRILCI